MKTYTQQDTQLEKILFFTSLTTALFTLGIFINHTFFQSEHVLIGVFQELLTLPAILAQPIIIAMSFTPFYSEQL
ncbi:hypothetical protein R9C00_16460 [Flammeovirgaceae bacterium SG7u.111]|nr:hypothetical protein [Flammeovirgaceae bacterium SG7u.132]WPO33295.1 hypothetical protein R9C00_16460 [Flammeovirgaceae bacterium SG7u.111]